MNLYIQYIIIGITILFILYIIFLYLLSLKIDKLENIILEKFKEKNNQIPSIFEVTKYYFIKHDRIFKEILLLRKNDFSENSIHLKLMQKSRTNKLIHNELNFIFRVANKYPKLQKNGKYIFLNDIIINKSLEISKKLKLYKHIVNQYNYMIMIKNLTIIGLLFPISKKDTL